MRALTALLAILVLTACPPHDDRDAAELYADLFPDGGYYCECGDD